MRPMPLLFAATATPQQTAAPLVASPHILAEQAVWEKSKGQWSKMPSSTGRVCVHRTQDEGRSCRKKTDYQGEYFATSGTCSSITLLVGCNDILHADGKQVTLCLQ